MWIMVEKVTDTVLCMDPYPWDDVDEEFTVDLPEFLLRWKLTGSVAIHLDCKNILMILTRILTNQTAHRLRV